MKNLTLTIKERVVLMESLPKEGSKLEQIIIRQLSKKLDFTLEEIEELGIKIEKTNIFWKKESNDYQATFELENSEVEVLKNMSKELDRNKKVTPDNLSFIEKIDDL